MTPRNILKVCAKLFIEQRRRDKRLFYVRHLSNKSLEQWPLDQDRRPT
jgi:hypothetical protein